MKVAVFAILIFLGISVFGQSTNHEHIPGTKCSIIPPAGFVAIPNFSGFQQEETQSTIMVTQLAGPYHKIVAGLLPENLARQSMTLVSKEILDYNGTEATSVKVSQKANGLIYLKEMLVFGYDSITVMAVGTYPESYKRVEGIVHQALFTTIYNSQQDDDPLAAARFTIDVMGSGFKLDRSVSGLISYKMDDLQPTKKPTLVAAESVGKVAFADLKQYSIGRLKQLPGHMQAQIKEVNPITIDDLDGYEIIAYNRRGSIMEQTYQVMLFNEDKGYFIMAGQARDNHESNLALFRKITATFKRKQS